MNSRFFLLVFTAVAVIFAMQLVSAGNPVYDYNWLNVYKSTSTTLGSGELVCEKVNLASDSECLDDMLASTSYRFETLIKNISNNKDGTPTAHNFQSSVGFDDVLGTFPLTTSCGCEGNSNWTIGLTLTDVTCTLGGGSPCQIDKGGVHNVNFWFLITLASDPVDDRTADFYVSDAASVNETSSLTTFNIGFPNNPPTLDITLPDGGETWTTSPQDINFTITDADCPTKACDLNVGLWYSTSQGAYTTAINIDLNVMKVVDMNCGNDYDFTNGSNCSYRWDISGVNDGTYYIDAQLYDGTDLNYDSSNASFTIDLPPVISTGSHDGNVLHDQNVQFHASCTNAGDNFSIFVCTKTPGNDPNFGGCYTGTNEWCSSTAGTDTTPDCNVTASCGALPYNKPAYVTCCDDGGQCDITSYETLTFKISDEVVFLGTPILYSPAEDTSKTNCELDYFDINGIKNFCNDAILTDAYMEVFANGTSVCTDSTGDLDVGPFTASYACTATMSITDYTWSIDVNAPNTLNTEGNTTMNIAADRNYVVKNDEFSYTEWRPDDGWTYDDTDTIDFNVSLLQNSCGAVIDDAIVSFWDNTENAQICSDTTGVTGFYECPWTAGTAPLDESTETVYSSVARANYDDLNSATRTLNLNLEDLSFEISYPSSGCSDTNGCYGGGCSICTYCAFYSNGFDQNEVNCSGQTLATPFYAYDNQSSPSTDQTWTMDLNANITGTGMWHKVSTDSGGYEIECTNDQPPVGATCVYVMTTGSPITIATGITAAGDKDAWAWADFVNVGVGTTDRNVTSTSTAT